MGSIDSGRFSLDAMPWGAWMFSSGFGFSLFSDSGHNTLGLASENRSACRCVSFEMLLLQSDPNYKVLLVQSNSSFA